MADSAAPRPWTDRVFQQEGINFLLTNRIPRRWATLLYARLARIEHPWVVRLGLVLWQRFGGDLQLHEAEASTFRSLNDCFIRRLRPGARPVAAAPELLTSPCDAVVGASGPIHAGQVLQAKGLTYALRDLVGVDDLPPRFAGGSYVTLRLRSSFYHRFHAPDDLEVEAVTYIAGDTWNVNPIALKRVERLFCRNERAVIDCRLDDGTPLCLVAVAAILVASIRLHWLDGDLDLRYGGPTHIRRRAHFARGQEMGYFQHGSTIIVLAPPGVSLMAGLGEGVRVQTGQALLGRGEGGLEV